MAKQDKKAKETKVEEIEETLSEGTTAKESALEEQTADETETLKEKNKELEDKLLRQMAEFDNFRKRTLKEKEEIYKAIEWKDGKVYVLDPLFLFYL